MAKKRKKANKAEAKPDLRLPNFDDQAVSDVEEEVITAPVKISRGAHQRLANATEESLTEEVESPREEVVTEQDQASSGVLAEDEPAKAEESDADDELEVEIEDVLAEESTDDSSEEGVLDRTELTADQDILEVDNELIDLERQADSGSHDEQRSQIDQDQTLARSQAVLVPTGEIDEAMGDTSEVNLTKIKAQEGRALVEDEPDIAPADLPSVVMSEESEVQAGEAPIADVQNMQEEEMDKANYKQVEEQTNQDGNGNGDFGAGEQTGVNVTGGDHSAHADSANYETENEITYAANDLEVEDDAEAVRAELAAANASLAADLAEIQANIKTDEIGRVLAREPKKHWLRNILLVILGLVLLLGVAAGTAYLLNRFNVFDLFNQPEESQNPDQTLPTTEDEENPVNYDIAVTDQAGVPVAGLVYKVETGGALELHFAKTADQTIGQVLLAGQDLVQEVDYSVEDRGDVAVLKINAAKMATLATGDYEVILELKRGERVERVGLKFRVEALKICGEGEHLENENCVKDEQEAPKEQPKEQPAKPSTPDQSHNNSNNSNAAVNPNPPAEPTDPEAEKPEEQKVCEAKAGPVAGVSMHWSGEGEDRKLEWRYVQFPGKAKMVWTEAGCQVSLRYSGSVRQSGGVSRLVDGQLVVDDLFYTVIGSHAHWAMKQDRDLIFWSYTEVEGFANPEFFYLDDATRVWTY